MNKHKRAMGVAVWLIGMLVYADPIIHNGVVVDMAWVTIGNAGNAADTSGYGAVAYNYGIGKYEVTQNQWSTVAAAAGIGGGGVWSGDQPAAYLSWYQAAQFCNWLTSGDKYLGAYQFNTKGALTNINRSVVIDGYGTVYALPTEDEWYKAAYYTGSGYSLYANGDDTAPVAGVDALYAGASAPWTVGSGAVEQNGTYDMMGNVWELNESALDGVLDTMSEDRLVRGGSFGSTVDRLLSNERWGRDPSSEADYIGFRVVVIPEPASVPEPATATLLFLGSIIGFWMRRHFVD
jgi:formylglycine-generating enzyme required for sulfatase activity